MVVATADHWHAPAAILACCAGKHVYVEKPCCHNPREGELLLEAARKHRRMVQHGTQRRSWPAQIEAVQRLRNGEIGRVLLARAVHVGVRASVGRGQPAPVPAWLDYELWQGPAPRRPYRDNIVHYNWHFFWHWGSSEIGNNGVHKIDVARWGLGVGLPRRVTSCGAKLYFDDDGETPDTHLVNYDFGDKILTFENRNWHRRGFEGTDAADIAFYGDRGSLIIGGTSYKIYDRENRQIGQGAAAAVERPTMWPTCWTPFATALRSTPRSKSPFRARCSAIWARSPIARATRSPATQRRAESSTTRLPRSSGRASMSPVGNRKSFNVRQEVNTHSSSIDGAQHRVA